MIVTNTLFICAEFSFVRSWLGAGLLGFTCLGLFRLTVWFGRYSGHADHDSGNTVMKITQGCISTFSQTIPHERGVAYRLWSMG